MWKIFGILILGTGALQGALSVTIVGKTQTQALMELSGFSGPCTLEVSTSNTLSPLVPDVDSGLYSGANIDTSRADTFTRSSGTIRVVTIGHNVLNRALSAETGYFVRVSGCGGPVTKSFDTPTLAMGSTVGWAVPWDSTQWANRALPTSQSQLLGKDPVIEPQFGTKHTPVSSALDWTYTRPKSTVSSGLTPSFVTGGTGWTSGATIVNGGSSSASTSGTNPIYVFPGQEMINGDGQDGAYLQASLNDMAASLYGSGTDASQGNRDFTIQLCLSTCLGSPITIHPTQDGGGSRPHIDSSSGDAAKPFPNSFPTAFFSGWGGGVIHQEDWPTNGTANCTSGVCDVINPLATNHQAFSVALVNGDPVQILGSDPTCPGDVCTVDHVVNPGQVVLSQSFSGSGVSWTAGRIRFKIQKVTGTGTLSLGMSYKFAGGLPLDFQSANEVPNCNINTVTTGDVPAEEANVCRINFTHTGFQGMYSISTGGNARMLYGGATPADAYFTGLGFAAEDIPWGSIISFGAMVPDETDGRTWHLYETSAGPMHDGGGPKLLYKMTYTGDFTEDRNWNYTLAIGGDNYVQYAPSDYWTWSLELSGSQSLTNQLTSLFPSYNQALYGTGSAFALVGTSGGFYYFENNYNGVQDQACYVAVVEISTGTLTGLWGSAGGDGMADKGFRFAGCHNLTSWNHAPGAAQLSTHELVASNPALLHGGPFQILISGVMRNGTFDTSNTRLPWPPVAFGGTDGYDNDCSVLAPAATSMYAVGTNCARFQVSTNGFCNQFPRADELIANPCPWNGAYAQPFPMAVGDIIFDLSSDFGFGEMMEIVKINSSTDIVVARNATAYGQCVAPGTLAGSVCGNIISQNQHGNTISGITVNSGGSGYAVGQTGCVIQASSYVNPVGQHASGTYRVTSVGGGGTVTGVSVCGPQYCNGGTYGGGSGYSNASGLATAISGCFFAGSGSGTGLTVDITTTKWWGGAGSKSTYPAITPTLMVTGTDSGAKVQGVPIGGHSDFVSGTVPGTGVYASTNGATVQKPVATAFDFPIAVNSFVEPSFHGTQACVGCGSVQAYTNLLGDSKFMLDSNTLNNNGGGVTIGPRTLTPVSGSVYKVTPIGVMNPKIYPLHGWSGRYLYQEVSGPGSDIVSSGSWTMCYVFTAGECYSGSTVGEVYVNDPFAWDAIPGNCVTALPWVTSPCAISMPGLGQFRRQGLLQADTNSSFSQQLSLGLGIPGEAYPFGLLYQIDTRRALVPPQVITGWGKISYTVELPTWVETGATLSDFVQVPIVFPPGDRNAQVQFGVSRYTGPDGDPLDFLCTQRLDGCHTGGDPFSYDSESGGGISANLFGNTVPPTYSPPTDNFSLGTKFYSSDSGTITGVRFYKNILDTGPHTGALYNELGTQLAFVAFTGESASGWQEMSFPSSVAITANTNYWIVVYTPTGASSGTAATGFTNFPLVFIQAGSTQGGSGILFPSSFYGSGLNFAVDIVYAATGCTAGCTVSMNIAGPAVVYYRTRRSPDGVTWTNGDMNAVAVSGVPDTPCNDLTFTPTSSSGVSAGGGSGTFSVSVTDQSCSWALSSSAGWLACTANCSGTGNQPSVGWSAGVNASGARSGTLSVALGPTFTVSQNAQTPGSTQTTGIVSVTGVSIR